jgi:hypothetical protein
MDGANAAAVADKSKASTAPVRRPTLFDLEAEYLAMLARLDDGEDVPEPEIATLARRLVEVDAKIDAKVDGWCRLITQLDRDAEAAKAEADRLAARASRFDRHGTWLRDALKGVLVSTGKEKVRTALFNVSVRANPPSVGKVDERAVAGRFVKTEFVRAIDKKAILDEYRATKIAPMGVEIVTDRTRLEIK